MRYVRVAGVIGSFAILTLGSVARADAQSNDEGFPQIQWNFSTPGARANAMGRAFIGLADDASASITNPAGLLKLTKPQAYFEFKSTNLKVQRLANPTSLFTLVPTTFAQTVNVPSFISFSMPLGDRLAVGFTRHEFLAYKETFHLGPRPIPMHPTNNIFFPVDGTADFTAVSYAGSVAATVGPQLWVGVTVSNDRLKATSLADRFDFISNSTANQFDLTKSTILANETAVNSTSSALGVVVGALWSPTPQVSVGLQYSKGPKFVVSETKVLNPGFGMGVNLPPVPEAGFPKTVHINVPDRLGVGVAVRPFPRLLAAFDALRIGYSSLAKNFTVVFSPDILTGAEYTFADIVELHAGGEYLLMPGTNRVFVRAGVYTNPNHTTKFSSAPDAAVNATESAIYNLLPRKTDVVGTVGAGIAIGARAQIDFAYLFKREAVISAGVRF